MAKHNHYIQFLNIIILPNYKYQKNNNINIFKTPYITETDVDFLKILNCT